MTDQETNKINEIQEALDSCSYRYYSMSEEEKIFEALAYACLTDGTSAKRVMKYAFLVHSQLYWREYGTTPLVVWEDEAIGYVEHYYSLAKLIYDCATKSDEELAEICEWADYWFYDDKCSDPECQELLRFEHLREHLLGVVYCDDEFKPVIEGTANDYVIHLTTTCRYKGQEEHIGAVLNYNSSRDYHHNYLLLDAPGGKEQWPISGEYLDELGDALETNCASYLPKQEVVAND